MVEHVAAERPEAAVDLDQVALLRVGRDAELGFEGDAAVGAVAERGANLAGALSRSAPNEAATNGVSVNPSTSGGNGCTVSPGGWARGQRDDKHRGEGEENR